MKLLVVDCGSTKVPLFSEKLNSFNQECDQVKLNDFNEASLNGYNKLIISGAPILVTEIDPKPYLNRFSFITSLEIPILGVCFGHQILGMLHGATAIRCKEAREDMHIDLLDSSPLFHEISDFRFNEDHCEAISVPHSWKHLASSSICTNEAMEHTTKPWYGVQFHPESSGHNGTQLLKNFCISCS